MSDEAFIAKLEAAGEEAVRRSVAVGIYASSRLQVALNWLAWKDRQRENEFRSAEMDALSAANDHANRANMIAILSAVASVVSTVIAGFALYFSLTK